MADDLMIPLPSALLQLVGVSRQEVPGQMPADLLDKVNESDPHQMKSGVPELVIGTPQGSPRVGTENPKGAWLSPSILTACGPQAPAPTAS